MAKPFSDGQGPGGRPIRLKDVAAKAGLSLATVSYAMRNSPMVSKATAKRVQALAKKMGYVPSPAMGALAEYKRRTGKGTARQKGFSTLAIVHAYAKGQWPGQLNRRRVFEAIEERAGELGYKVEIFDAGHTKDSQRSCSRTLYNRGITGIFVAPHLYNEKDCVPVELDWRRFVGISVLNEQPERKLHAVLPSWVRNRQIVLKQIAQCPDASVGAFVTKVHSAWLGGLSEFFVPHVNHLDGTPSTWVPSHLAETYDKPVFLKWFDRYKPDIIVTNIEWVPTWLRELGLRVPEEHGVIFIDQVQEDWRSGIDVLPRHIGITAVNLMHDQLRNMNTGLPEHPYRLTVPGEWHPGTTFNPDFLTKSLSLSKSGLGKTSPETPSETRSR
jgi:LacI family transcriptional regulator